MNERIRKMVSAKFAPVERVRLAYLYGSYARGEARPDSDVDIGVVIDRRLSAPDKLALELELEGDLEAAGLAKPDVHVLNTAPLLLQGAVVTEGCLLFARDETERVAYEAGTRSRYFDYLPAAQAMSRTFAEALAARLRDRTRKSLPGGGWPE